MAESIPIDAARLRAAVADNRYWQAGHPERDGWRAWVGKGFETLYGPGNSAGAAVVHVRAYIRNGHQVAAHTRSPPVRMGGDADPASEDPGPSSPSETGGKPAPRFGSLVLRRRNLLDPPITPVAVRRPDGGVIGQRPNTIPEGGGGGGGGGSRSPGTRGTPPTAPTPSVSPRSQEILDVVAPRGQPIGAQQQGASPDIRTLPGGQPAAEAMFQRLIAGRNPTDITPPRYPGRMYRLDDGSVIGYRPTSSSSSPAIDINIPGAPVVTKLHF